MSGLFGATVIKGTRITEFSETTATVGITIPFGYGGFTSGGNVIWAPLPPKEHRNVVRQGKGGVKQEQFSYTLSYAIAFSKGPITGYWWIKRNGKVVYTQDPAAPIEDQEYAAKWLERATLYFGTMDQLPDSTIESYEGSGQISAFRHLAYIVVEDDDVTDGGGAVPTYEACVIVGAARSYTTPPYPILDTGGLRPSSAVAGGSVVESVKEYLNVAFAIPLGGQIRDTVQNYNPPLETLSISAALPIGGAIETIIFVKDYEMQGESLSMGALPLNGAVTQVTISYENYPAESMAPSCTPLGGQLNDI